MAEQGWTLDELTQRVEQALALATREGRYPGPRDGRARELPDRRAIRWYTTIGLVDRPLGMRGRTALYGGRHLRQLVAIKFRQAAGRTISEIQQELTGIGDGALRAIVALGSADPPANPPPGCSAGPVGRDQRVDRGRRFWTDPPAPSAETTALNEDSAASATHGGTTSPRVVPDPVVPDPVTSSTARLLSAVALAHGVVLMVPATLHADDLAAIGSAATPLLDVLAARGLIDPTEDHRR